MYKTINLEKYPNIRESINVLQTPHPYNMRYSKLKTPHCRSELCKQSLLNQGIQAWNQLSIDIKISTSLKSLKSKCKERLVSRY